MMEMRLKSTYLELLFVCLCLLTVLGPAEGETVVRVDEGSEAVLPCFINPRRDIRQKVFDWRKDDQKEVFLYEKGQHYNNGRDGQDEQFKGRVSHFPDQLQSGDASIRIRDTKPSDSGTYTCDISPDEVDRQTYTIELVVSAVVKAREGSEAVLPCFINPRRDITQVVFDWKKDGQTEVFFHDNQGHNRQGEEFRGRVFHFPDQLQSGNASIRIRDTKLSDRGNYTCHFPLLQPKGQTFYTELVVVCDTIKDRSEENIRGASPKPSVKTLKQTKDLAILKCKVRGVSPKPEVKWLDSSGKNLNAEETQVSKTGGSYDIILQTTVTKTDNYRCVVTQEEICHQVSDETAVYFHESSTVNIGVTAVVSVLVTLLVVGVILAVLYIKSCIKLDCKKGPGSVL